ncbi:MAG: hypothetical protein AAF715_28710 [Myxococcota bacterium]
MSKTEITATVSGNTYPVREYLKAAGYRWDRDDKVWTTDYDGISTVKDALDDIYESNGKKGRFARFQVEQLCTIEVAS